MALFGIDDSPVIIGAIILVAIAWWLSEWRAPASKKGSEFRL